MLQSTHYELKLVEGSDIVNPLVIDRPNYETIDGVMYENESKSIGNATELKSGTIHALTRTKGNQRFFCFTATSNYDAGDTFTVDSVPVTALLPNGTALPDNAYVVNGTVLCSLIGTLLTVYTVGSVVADDSLRLGGELPSYYATASDLTRVETTANAASTLSINNADDIRTIQSNLTTFIGESTTGQTWEQQLTTIGTLYGNLSSTQKMRSYILDSGGYKYFIQDINTGGFNFIDTTSSSVEIDSFNVTSHKFISAKYIGNTWSITDKSNETLNRILRLYA